MGWKLHKFIDGLSLWMNMLSMSLERIFVQRKLFWKMINLCCNIYPATAAAVADPQKNMEARERRVAILHTTA